MNSNLIKNTVAWLLLLAVSLVILETGSYLIWVKVLTKKKSNGVFKVKQIIGVSLPDQNIISNPYSLFWNNPNFKDEFGLQYNSLGHRNKYESQVKVDFKILVLGGSTTNAYPYVKDPSKIWTSVLEMKLKHEFPNHSFAVINAGAPYATSAELLSHYIFTAMDIKPNLIIFHEGGNDVAPLLFENYKSDYSHFRQSTASPNGRPFEKTLLTYSYGFRCFYAFWLHNEGVYQAQPYGFERLDRVAALKRVRESSSPAFKRNVENIVRIALAEKSHVLLVGFLQAQKSQLAKNRPDAAGLEDAMIEGVEKHDLIMKDIAGRYSIQFLKLEQNKFSPLWFMDNCHLNEEGELEKANQIFLPVKQAVKLNGW